MGKRVGIENSIAAARTDLKSTQHRIVGSEQNMTIYEKSGAYRKLMTGH